MFAHETQLKELVSYLVGNVMQLEGGAKNIIHEQ